MNQFGNSMNTRISIMASDDFVTSAMHSPRNNPTNAVNKNKIDNRRAELKLIVDDR